MKRFSLQLVLALAALTLLAAVAPAAAEERPFKATGVGGIGRSGEMYARGFEGTHLGKAIFYGGVDLDEAQYPVILKIPAYLTAANGDRLYLDSVVYNDVDTGIAIGTLTFNGGTGRFRDATGSADVMFVFDPDFQHFLFLIDGSIDF